MTLKDRVKWYGLVSACVCLSLIIYVETAYVYSDRTLDSILGYLKFTAGFSALAFGSLFLLGPREVKAGVEWYGAVSACVFLVVSTYMQVTWVFYDVRVGRVLNHLEFMAALASLIFGLLTLPRWQSIVALAVWVYSFYRFSQPAFGVG